MAYQAPPNATTTQAATQSPRGNSVTAWTTARTRVATATASARAAASRRRVMRPTVDHPGGGGKGAFHHALRGGHTLAIANAPEDGGIQWRRTALPQPSPTAIRWVS